MSEAILAGTQFVGALVAFLVVIAAACLAVWCVVMALAVAVHEVSYRREARARRRAAEQRGQE